MIFTLLYRYMIFSFFVDFNWLCLKLCKTFLSTVNNLIIIIIIIIIRRICIVKLGHFRNMFRAFLQQ